MQSFASSNISKLIKVVGIEQEVHYIDAEVCPIHVWFLNQCRKDHIDD